MRAQRARVSLPYSAHAWENETWRIEYDWNEKFDYLICFVFLCIFSVNFSYPLNKDAFFAVVELGASEGW